MELMKAYSPFPAALSGMMILRGIMQIRYFPGPCGSGLTGSHFGRALYFAGAVGRVPRRGLQWVVRPGQWFVRCGIGLRGVVGFLRIEGLLRGDG